MLNYSQGSHSGATGFIPVVSVICALLTLTVSVYGQSEWQSGAPGANASRWGGGPAGQNWTAGVPDSTGAWARFGNLDGGLNTRAITLEGNRTVGRFDVTRNVNAASFSINNDTLTFNNGASAALLELFNGNSVTLNSLVALQSALNVNQSSTGTLTFANADLYTNHNNLTFSGTGQTNLQSRIRQNSGNVNTTSSVTLTGPGTVRTTRNDHAFSGGLNVNNGTYLADLTGAITIAALNNNSALGRGAVSVNGASSLLDVNATGNIAYNRNTSIDNGGTVRLSPGGNITSLGGAFTVGSGGGILDLNGYVTDNTLTLHSTAGPDAPAIIRTNTMFNNTSWGGWASGSTLTVNGNSLTTGNAGHAVKLEITNGALVEQDWSGSGSNHFGGTLIISGQPGGDASVGSSSTNVGRYSIMEGSAGNNSGGTYTYAGGIFFENAVQFTIFNWERTVDADITVRDGAQVAFQGRSASGGTDYHDLTLGATPNSRTLLVENGGEAILDIRYRTDNAGAVTGGITLNAHTVIEDSGTLRFTNSNNVYAPGTQADFHTVNGNITGQGFGSTRATDALLIIDDSITATGLGSVDWSNSMSFNVEGADCNGLRLEANLANLQRALNNGTANGRLETVTGSGGVLTLALNNSSAQNLTIDRAPTSGSEVKLGFDVAPGGTQANTYTLGTTANDLANWNGLAVKGGTVEMAVNQSFTGGATDSTLCLLGGSLNLGDNSTPRTLTIQGDATLAGGTLSGGTQAGAKGTLVSSGGDFINNGTTFANTPNLTSTTDGSSSLTGSQGFTGIGTLTMAGTGTLTLVQTVEAQTIEVSSGTLVLGGNNRISDSTNIVLSGGTFAANGFSDEMGTLTLTENSVIDFGGGDSILRFADSSGESWNPDATLTIVNWGGEPIVGGGLDRLFVGTSGGGLTSGQLSQIKFAEYPNFSVTQLPDGEVVPVPEPATIIAGIGLLGFFVWRERDRLLRWWRSVRGKF